MKSIQVRLSTCMVNMLYKICYTGHRCSKNGCGNVLVVDGNLKNHRSVCAPTDAGYIQYTGLPGTIKSGCTNTPCQKSRFCPKHKPRPLTSQTESNNKVDRDDPRNEDFTQSKFVQG